MQFESLAAAQQASQATVESAFGTADRVSMLESQLNGMMIQMSAATGYGYASTSYPCGQGHSPPGMPGGGSSGDTVPPCFSSTAGGNGICHCVHVEDLIRRVGLLEARPTNIPRDAAGREPFLPRHQNGMPDLGWRKDENFDPTKPLDLTMPFGPLGNVEKLDRSIYDDKLTTQAEYTFDGGKGGAAWKSKVERYFISKIPIAMEILKWAEKHDHAVITEDSFINVSQHKMTLSQCQTFNGAIWGFLSGCLSGQAEIQFNRADMLNGLDSWRRIVRMIDSSLPLKLEELRSEVRMIHTKPIKDLEGLATGVAEFDTKIEEYRKAGGTGYESDSVRKSDLLAILPTRLEKTFSGDLAPSRATRNSETWCSRSRRPFWHYDGAAEFTASRSTRTGQVKTTMASKRQHLSLTSKT
jgi:hypothetical protein